MAGNGDFFTMSSLGGSVLLSSFFAPNGLRSARDEVLAISGFEVGSGGLISSFLAPKGDTFASFLGSGFGSSSAGLTSSFLAPKGLLAASGFGISWGVRFDSSALAPNGFLPARGDIFFISD